MRNPEVCTQGGTAKLLDVRHGFLVGHPSQIHVSNSDSNHGRLLLTCVATSETAEKFLTFVPGMGLLDAALIKFGMLALSLRDRYQ